MINLDSMRFTCDECHQSFGPDDVFASGTYPNGWKCRGCSVAKVAGEASTGNTEGSERIGAAPSSSTRLDKCALQEALMATCGGHTATTISGDDLWYVPGGMINLTHLLKILSQREKANA